MDLSSCRQSSTARGRSRLNVLRTYRSLLGNGPLTRLLAGEFVSSIGDWLYLVALLIVVWDRPDSSPALLGVVGAARVLPYVLLSVPAGFVADRFDRRLVLMVTDLARGVIMLAIAALVALDGPLLGIVGLAVLATCFSAFFGPTIGSYLPRLVRDEGELGPANSAWASLDSLAFVIGPAVGGLLVAASGLTWAFILNALSFAFVASVLWRLPSARAQGELPDPPEGEVPRGDAPPPAQVSLAAALRAAGRPLAGLLLMDLVTGFVFGGLSVLTVVLATDVLRAGDAATGILNAAIGVGGLIGALLAGVLVLRRSLVAPLLAGGLALAAGVAVLGLLTSLAFASLALVVTSIGSLIVEVVSLTLLQRSVPDAVRGRALGIVETAGVSTYALGSLAMPIAAAAFGMDRLLLAAGLAVAGAIGAGATIIGRGATRAPALTPDAIRFVGLPILAGLAPARLEGAAAQLVPLTVAPGQVIVRQGEAADRLYFIAEGRFAVTQADPAGGPERDLRTMGPDQLFGEIGLLTGSARTATVTALSPGRLLALDGPAFLDLVGSGAGLTSRLLDLHRGVISTAGGAAGG